MHWKIEEILIKAKAAASKSCDQCRKVLDNFEGKTANGKAAKLKLTTVSIKAVARAVGTVTSPAAMDRCLLLG